MAIGGGIIILLFIGLFAFWFVVFVVGPSLLYLFVNKLFGENPRTGSREGLDAAQLGCLTAFLVMLGAAVLVTWHFCR